MHKATIYKLLRCLVCLILVCCILINCSPIRAEATVVGGVVVSGVTAAGVLGWLFAAAMGVVFVDVTYNFLTGIGNDVRSHVEEYYKNDIETTNTLIGYLDGLSYDFGGSDDGTNNNDSSNDKNLLTHLPTALLVALMDWVKDLIKGDTSVEVEGEEAPEGYAYYNGVLLPEFTLSSTYPNACILQSKTSGNIFLYKLNSSVTYIDYYLSSNYYRAGGKSCSFNFYVFDGSSWVLEDSDSGLSDFVLRDRTLSGSGISLWPSSFIWSSMPVYSNSDGSLVHSASDKSYIETIPVEPSTYVGDIPQQVQDGTFDDDEYQLPYINPTPFFQNQTDVVDALNNVASKLEDQTMTYEQYMEQIQTQPDPDPGPGEDPGNNPEQDPNSNLGKYALDLTNYFPFCIPFDLYDFLSCLAADPVAPVIEWVIPLPGGDTYPIEVDLSPFDSVAQLLRQLQLLLFCVGLAIKTRDLIKG